MASSAGTWLSISLPVHATVPMVTMGSFTAWRRERGFSTPYNGGCQGGEQTKRPGCESSQESQKIPSFGKEGH